MLYAARSHIGLVRQNNEDNYAVHELGRFTLAVVADGMGGASAGEVASGIAAETVCRLVKDGLEEPSVEPLEVLRGAIDKANQDIWDASRKNVDFLGMGTTLVAALYDDTNVYLGHVGDSRAYRFQGGACMQITRDHSLVGELVRRGQITEDEAQKHPQRNIVTRSLGTSPQSEPEMDEFTWTDGDTLLLCTDGLTDLVSTSDLASELQPLTTTDRELHNEDVAQVADHLIRVALERGAPDNVTLILVSYRKEIGA